MTISRRLTILLAIPLLALVAFGVFVEIQIGRVEVLSRFVVDMQIESVATLGKVLRRFAEARIEVRNYLLAQNPAEQERAAKALPQCRGRLEPSVDASMARSSSPATKIEDCGMRSSTCTADGRRRPGRSSPWPATGRRDAAIDRMFTGTFPDLGLRATNVLEQWVDHNEHLASTAGNSSLTALANSRRNLLIVVGLVLLLSGIGGIVTFRRIVIPIRGLQKSVEAIAGGDYSHPVPFTEATDETGALARSMEVLRAWRQPSRRKTAGSRQTSPNSPGRCKGRRPTRSLRAGCYRVWCRRWAAGLRRSMFSRANRSGCAGWRAMGWRKSGGADYLQLGEGLAGQCARDRCPTVLTDLPPGLSADILRTGRRGAHPGCRLADSVGRHAAGRARIRVFPRVEGRRRIADR